MGVIVESKEKAVKICPFVSNTEIAFAQNPLSKEPKMTPKFAPMGCLNKACMFYNEDYKRCFFEIQTVMLTKLVEAQYNVKIKGE